MELRFDPKQEYQLNAIESVVKLFQGQPIHDKQIETQGGFVRIPNHLDLPEDAILRNLQDIQRQNGIEMDSVLKTLDNEIVVAGNSHQVCFPNFSVEMETGTGKTYVYLRTALELYARYGMKKFIVVVPSVAIREGVLKTLRITRKHMREIYGNIPYAFYVYDSSQIFQVKQFAHSDGLQIMVMTIDSFNKASNVINEVSDRLGEVPLSIVQSVRPILILDEPQNMESELSIKSLCSLDPLFALRYSATHRNHYSLVFRLTPFEAYRQGLVKQVEVAGIERDDLNDAFIRLDNIDLNKKSISANLTVHKLLKNGVVKEQKIKVKPGENLENRTERHEYSSFVVEEIDATRGVVRFSNGVELKSGGSIGPDKEPLFEMQIKYTIEAHFRKQQQLKNLGIKVLSLFFIDKVDNYREANGIIRRIFNDSFNEIKLRYPEWATVDPEKVQVSYFASRRTRQGELIQEDSKTGESERDKEAYDLIMKDKERLLSFGTPCFIFTHSALREGWDNPNVFQICTLNQTTSEMKKRQEIGRGIRLAVNQEGVRINDRAVNLLTVVANQSYEKFVAAYQSELEEAYGREEIVLPPNARKSRTVRLRKNYLLSPEFKELWERVRQKTRYAIRIDTEKLIADVLADLDKATIEPPKWVTRKAIIQVDREAEKFSAIMTARQDTATSRNSSIPNILPMIEDLMRSASPPVRVTRSTIVEIFSRISQKDAALANPYLFATTLFRVLEARLADQLVNGIVYIKISEWYEMAQFDSEMQSWEQYLARSERDGKDGKSVYDWVEFDSEVERQFIVDLERDPSVKLYIKLPRWFVVPTPVGSYNPDWAIVKEKCDLFGERQEILYLVRETKGSKSLEDLWRPDERRKVICGEKHFVEALGVDYKVVTREDELP